MNDSYDSSQHWFYGLPMSVRVIAWLGIPSAIAVLMMGITFGWIKTPLLANHDIAMRESAASVVTVVTAHEAAESSRYVERTIHDREVIGLLREICRRVSKSDAQREGCWR